MSLMTVAAMADRAERKGDERTPFIERCRHWSRQGLLKPTGKAHPGTGKRKRYSDEEYENALILDELADFGLPIAVQETVKLLARDARRDWREKIARGERIILEIAKLPDGSFFPHCHTGAAAMAGGQAISAVSIDLAKIFRGPDGDVIIPTPFLDSEPVTIEPSDFES
jgi:hypothetical protein